MKSDSKIFVWLSGDVFSTNLQPSATDEEAKGSKAWISSEGVMDHPRGWQFSAKFEAVVHCRMQMCSMTLGAPKSSTRG